MFSAFPLLRLYFHNVFEVTHRISGWTGLALLWIFIILTLTYDPLTNDISRNISDISGKQEFMYAVIVTVLIILPWLTTRKVPVTAMVVSPKV